MAEQSVTLNPGESKLVTFEVIPSEARMYQVTVNGLAGSFEAIVPWQLIPCVYCGATFTTEEELISHMEAYHPSKPYLISLVAPSWIEESRKGHWICADIIGKGYMPNTPDRYDLRCTFYIGTINAVCQLYRTGYGASEAEFFESPGLLCSYSVSKAGVSYMPPGIYSIKSKCYLTTYDGKDYHRSFVWRDADTGIMITVI